MTYGFGQYQCRDDNFKDNALNIYSIAMKVVFKWINPASLYKFFSIPNHLGNRRHVVVPTFHLKQNWDIIHIPQSSPFSSVQFSGLFTELWSHLYCLILEHFTTSERNPIPLALIPHCSFLKPRTTTDLFSFSMNLSIHCILYKWNYVIDGLLCLSSFFHHACKVHPCCSVCQYFISFYCQTHRTLLICPWL